MRKTKWVPWTFIIDEMNLPEVYYWSFDMDPPGEAAMADGKLMFYSIDRTFLAYRYTQSINTDSELALGPAVEVATRQTIESPSRSFLHYRP